MKSVRKRASTDMLCFPSIMYSSAIRNGNLETEVFYIEERSKKYNESEGERSRLAIQTGRHVNRQAGM